MLHVRHRPFGAALTAAAVLLAAGTAPSTFAMSITPESCSEFVRTYLEGGLPDGSTATFALDVYSIGLPEAEVGDVPTVLTLHYPRYPVVAGALSGAASDSPGILIAADHGQLHALVQTRSAEFAVEILGCRGSSQLYGTTGNEMVGLAFGHPEPPHPFSDYTPDEVEAIAVVDTVDPVQGPIGNLQAPLDSISPTTLIGVPEPAGQLQFSWCDANFMPLDALVADEG